MSLPVIAAPMFTVSNTELALATCAQGMMGSFPAHTTRSAEMLEDWLITMADGVARLADQGVETVGPYGVNLVVAAGNQRLDQDLALCIKHKVPVILTSKGAPGEVFDAVHDYGGIVFHDIGAARHAEKALAAGADGLIAVCGGAGGHCGTLNPFALVNEVRQMTDKAIILAGAISTGRDILAAQVMGADLVYMGTRFINTEESGAVEGYQQMIIEASATDIFFGTLTDAPSNVLAPCLIRAGVTLDQIRRQDDDAIRAVAERRKRWKDIWSAGHGVGAIHDVLSVEDLCNRLKSEYDAARAGLGRLQAAG
ncbi:MAG: nitronate monooxygenase [Rhodospirillaceae bacterium]|nr:nitronate monooxygenase [Rhodospirillaceae bacterium]MBT4485968.1 nitronate monooxygenase [Rhodospirillaceae bacterium]MBT5195754.1 nitronate monooxygenase [Rhodospirillaceae bacterium]MBT7757088.1 nitronate monooxygenase [Rhodospirillaceae bacterium]